MTEKIEPEDVQIRYDFGQITKQHKFYRHPLSGDLILELFGVPSGRKELRFTANSKKQIKIDAYLSNGNFDLDSVDPSGLIGTPGTSASVITVASYAWKDNWSLGNGLDIALSEDEGRKISIGAVSPRSSPGPTRLDLGGKVSKATFAAPGTWFIAPVPSKGQKRS